MHSLLVCRKSVLSLSLPLLKKYVLEAGIWSPVAGDLILPLRLVALPVVKVCLTHRNLRRCATFFCSETLC